MPQDNEEVKYYKVHGTSSCEGTERNECHFMYADINTYIHGPQFLDIFDIVAFWRHCVYHPWPELLHAVRMRQADG